jgi:hypothetical protein
MGIASIRGLAPHGGIVFAGESLDKVEMFDF